MALARLWSEPDGTVKVTVTQTDDPAVAAHIYARMLEAGTIAAGASWTDTTTDALASQLPADRRQRHKWRRQGGRVIVDPAVPDPPHPRQALLDQIDQATTIAALRAIVRKVIEEGP